jgi:hypothetical protein
MSRDPELAEAQGRVHYARHLVRETIESERVDGELAPRWKGRERARRQRLDEAAFELLLAARRARREPRSWPPVPL